jgi:predicted N-acetyltransferase YhbS
MCVSNPGGLYSDNRSLIFKIPDCHTVAVHPDYQGQGVGGQLMKWGMDVAEQLNLPIYLESTVEGVPLYKRLGFKTLSDSIVFKPEITRVEREVKAPLMVKMPKAAGNTTFEEWAAN